MGMGKGVADFAAQSRKRNPTSGSDHALVSELKSVLRTSS